jgi:hypothetical protein
MGTKIRHLTQADSLRARGEECRAIAEILTDPDARSSYIQLAESYEVWPTRNDSLR